MVVVCYRYHRRRMTTMMLEATLQLLIPCFFPEPAENTELQLQLENLQTLVHEQTDKRDGMFTILRTPYLWFSFI